jgi:hypothetical protein
MAGQESLGRLCNVIPIAAGKPFKMRGASVVMFVCTGATAAITLNERSSFGGADTALAQIGTVYWTTATDGTAAWNKLILTPKVSTFTNGTTTGLTTSINTVFHIFTSELSDPFSYLNCVAAGGGLVQAYLGDLVVQRGPAALEILGS